MRKLSLGPSASDVVLSTVEHPQGAHKTQRDWVELPMDAVAMVLGKLVVDDVLAGPTHVCRNWHRAAAEEPAPWRRVEARFGPGLAAPGSTSGGASTGWCEVYEAERVADNRILLYLVGWYKIHSFSSTGVCLGVAMWHQWRLER